MQRARVHLRRHLGQLLLHDGEVGERAAEDFAAADVPERLVERAAGEAERGGPDRRAEHVERGEGDLHPVARLAEERRARHAAAGEAQRTERVRRDRRDLPRHLEPRRVGRHDERAEAARPASAVRAKTT